MICLLVSSAALRAQTPLDPATLLQPKGSWPTYNGDYSGRRFSPLTKINTATVSKLEQAWTFRVETTTGGAQAHLVDAA